MKAWRDAASLILAARHGQKYNRSVAATTHNYNLLCLQRHHKSHFMPGSYVFPGGVVDPADADVKWRELFAAFGFDDGSLASLIPRVATRPLIFRPRQNELPREITLRITAIRETFEESGVLICRRRRDGGDAGISIWARHMSMPKNELQTWQSKVHKDATLFFELCEKLQCCPDLWALHEWSNWLTPTVMPTTRYNTIFYMACLPFKPNAKYEANEMEGLKWETPQNLMMDSTVLPPPQKYTIAQLAGLKDIDNLLDSAVERNKEGVQLYLPIFVQLKDGTVSVLPGDTVYPKEVNLLEKQIIIDKSDVTIDEYREMTPMKNRLEFHDMGIKVVVSDNLPTKGIQVSFVQKIAEEEPEIKNKL
ncbi:hypothetical protein DMN91_008749 [Ooceraea biroi]|uniref:Nucleoside diphosphate-linked moiety X motif 19, mitochondrial n=1 Tax=Ooceraea biroi TaxID=2015173 RepID=A0A026WP48_OOCBI|nr:nucleoside diphosphate-linked moiety X motif 19 [Ooceraea biroi]EZA57441.1 Nucleoside diphosphate-linked moiety X motif 19, mitochondrial [Ooceraea biroi]RLU18392.1 hypothetical protein DMN91_008749 [Ooceraea biroi]